MNDKIFCGFAFILEGDTEKEFYLSFFEYLCRKHGAEFSRTVEDTTLDVVYRMKKDDKECLIKFNTVNTVSQVPRAGKWFQTQCVKKYGAKIKWTVFLCYDLDDYDADISKFYEGDWAALRSSLSRAEQILDVAAAADIEDVMLQDLSGICDYLHGVCPNQLKGRKGKTKMKNLFLFNGKYYHSGKRARPLIDSLDMEKLIRGNLVPLYDIEKLVTSSIF